MRRQPRWSVQVRHGEYQGTKETLNISTHSLCFRCPPKLSIQQTLLGQPSKLWWKCSPEETMEKELSWGHEDPQQAGWEQSLVYSLILWWKMWASGDCSGYWNLVITSHPTSLHWMLPDYKWGCLPMLTLIKKHNTQIYLFHCWCVEPEHHHKRFPWA